MMNLYIKTRRKAGFSIYLNVMQVTPKQVCG